MPPPPWAPLLPFCSLPQALPGRTGQAGTRALRKKAGGKWNNEPFLLRIQQFSLGAVGGVILGAPV